MLVLPHSFCHGRLDTILHIQTKVVELWAYWSQSVCHGPQGQAFKVSDGATAKRYLSPVVRNACTKSSDYPSPYRLPRYMLLDLPQDVIRSGCGWLVSDFVSTPFALKPQLEMPPLPLLATYLMMMTSRMKSMFSFTARTLRWFLSAKSTRSYFHRQDSRTCLPLKKR